VNISITFDSYLKVALIEVKVSGILMHDALLAFKLQITYDGEFSFINNSTD
jgi:hypothetical protein